MRGLLTEQPPQIADKRPWETFSRKSFPNPGQSLEVLSFFLQLRRNHFDG